MNIQMPDPQTALPLQHLRERFPDLRKAEFDVIVNPPRSAAEILDGSRPVEKQVITGLAARCPLRHVGDLEGVVHFIEFEDGTWGNWGCDMGCGPVKVLEEARVMDARVPGEDDGEEHEKKKSPSQKLLAGALKLTRDSLRKTPRPRKFMLRDANSGAGVFLQGTAGLFAAAGGTGKGWSLMQLAICCSTGLTWFGPGGWVPVEVLRVLHLGGEDDEDELERRVLFSAQSAGAMSDEMLDKVATNLTALPLFGKGVALTGDEIYQARTGGLPETVFASTIREILRDAVRAGRPYGLVIIDPFSRFAGFDAEKDNASATRWVQVVETFIAKETGKPSVIIAHHTKKRLLAGKKEDANADLIRGASALKDGVRWAAVLEQQKQTQDQADLLTLRIVKANGVPPQLSPLVLCRDSKHEGALRVASSSEIDSNEKVASILKSKIQLIDNHKERVLAVFESGRTYSRRDLGRLCGGKGTLIAEAVRELLNEGVLFEPRRGTLQLREASGSIKGSTSESGPGNGDDQHASPHPFSLKERGEREASSPKRQQSLGLDAKSPPSGSTTGSREAPREASTEGGENGPR